VHFVAFRQHGSCDEGMWLLPLLEKMNIKNMKDAGLAWMQRTFTTLTIPA
jgi:hypothetical protein